MHIMISPGMAYYIGIPKMYQQENSYLRGQGESARVTQIYNLHELRKIVFAFLHLPTLLISILSKIFFS